MSWILLHAVIIVVCSCDAAEGQGGILCPLLPEEDTAKVLPGACNVTLMFIITSHADYSVCSMYKKLLIGARVSVSEPHLGSSTRPLSVCQSVSLSVYIYIYIYIYIYHTSVIFGPADPALRANVSRLI